MKADLAWFSLREVCSWHASSFRARMTACKPENSNPKSQRDFRLQIKTCCLLCSTYKHATLEQQSPKQIFWSDGYIIRITMSL